MTSANSITRPFVILLTVGLLVTLFIPFATRPTIAGQETAAQARPSIIGFNGLQEGQMLSGKAVIEAVVTGNNIDRVVFQLDGPQSKKYTDRSAPYFFGGDSNGVPNRWITTRYPDGDYTMTATAIDTAGQRGALTVHFRIANNAQPQPMATAQPTPSLGPVVTSFKGVQEGQALSGRVAIEAVVTGENIAQVVFQLDGPRLATNTERYAPYFFMSDNNGAPNGWDTTQYPNGDYTLTATATNAVGQSSSRQIYVPIVNSVQPQPTATPQPTTQPVPGVLYPPDTTLTLVTPPTIARPGYLAPIIDPTFGTRITRIADQAAFAITDKYIRHNYAKNQPWNSDGSLIMLGYPVYPAPILDGQTYKLLRWVKVPSWVVWSNTDPNRTYGTAYNNQFVSCDMTTGRCTVLHTFSEYDYVSPGEGEGNLSNDDRYVALQAKKGTNTYLVIYDIPNDTIVSRRDLGGKWPNNVSMSQSGNYVVVQWDANGPQIGQGTDVYDRALLNQKHLADNGVGHGDLGYDMQGNEVWVFLYPAYSITGYRLDGSGNTRYLENIEQGGHISCRNIKRPGWCYYSWFVDYGGGKQPGEDEVFAFRLDGSQVVERFAHSHHTPELGYEAETMAVPNRDGSKVMFASDWNGGGNVPVYSYIAEMR
jgi:hypothetical protein